MISGLYVYIIIVLQKVLLFRPQYLQFHQAQGNFLDCILKQSTRHENTKVKISKLLFLVRWKSFLCCL